MPECRAAATVARSSQGVVYLERRSNWGYAGGWTWGRRRISGRAYALHYAYRTPSWSFTVLGLGAFGGTASNWPQYLYPSVTSIPSLTGSRWQKDNYTAIRIPFWMLALLFSAAPIRLAIRTCAQYTKQRRVGFCRQCGYDLTANVSGVCPECGSSVYCAR